MMKNTFLSAVVALVVSAIAALFVIGHVSQSTPVVNENLGGLSERDIKAVSLNVGPANQFQASRLGAVRGNTLSTTTPASMTLAASDVVGRSSISSLLTVGAATLTLPASTTLHAAGWLTRVGETTSFSVINATTTAFNITVAGGTGSLLQNASTSAVILPGKVGLFFVTRKANTDYAFTFVPGI